MFRFYIGLGLFGLLWAIEIDAALEGRRPAEVAARLAENRRRYAQQSMILARIFRPNTVSCLRNTYPERSDAALQMQAARHNRSCGTMSCYGGCAALAVPLVLGAVSHPAGIAGLACACCLCNAYGCIVGEIANSDEMDTFDSLSAGVAGRVAGVRAPEHQAMH